MRRPEISAALYAASATQAAAERQADQRIRQQRSEIEELRLQLALGKTSAEATQVELAALRQEITAKERAFVAELEARDRAYAQEIAVFRDAVEDIASTPQGLEALAQFNAGDELGAIAILDDMRAARDAARQVRIDIESAVEARRIAVLALEARIQGKLTTADLIARYEESPRWTPASIGIGSSWGGSTPILKLATLPAPNARRSCLRKPLIMTGINPLHLMSWAMSTWRKETCPPR